MPYDRDGPLAETSTRRMVVFELRQKLEHLADYLGLGRTVTALADELRIPRRTIAEAATEGGCTKALHHQLRTAIAKRRKKFDPDWIEWRDPTSNASSTSGRRDTLEKFKERLYKENPIEDDVGEPREPGAPLAGVIEVEITINRPFAEFSEAEQKEFLDEVGRQLKIGRKIRINSKRPGSVKLRLALQENELHDLGALLEKGELSALKIDAIRSERGSYFARRSSKTPGLPTSKALVVYAPSRETKVREALDKRNQLADSFITHAPLGYVSLKVDDFGVSRPDPLTTLNLASDFTPRTRDLIRDLVQQSRYYFDCREDLNHSQGLRERGIWSVVAKRQSYADLEEEAIEEKFPGDISARALICAFVKATKLNYRTYAVRKLALQFCCLLPILMVAILWTPIVGRIASNLPFSVAKLALLSLEPRGVATAILLLMILAYTGAAAGVAKMALSWSYQCLRAIDDWNSQALLGNLTALNARIREVFYKLTVTDISVSQSTLESIKHDDWAERAEEVFKLGLWQAKRIEYLERFWRMEFDRLGVFKATAATADKWLPRLTGVSSVSIAAGLGYLLSAWINVDPLGYASLGLAAWYFSRVISHRRFSAAIKILSGDFDQQWRSFQTLGYYDAVAREFGAAKRQLRMQVLRDSYSGDLPWGRRMQ